MVIGAAAAIALAGCSSKSDDDKGSGSNLSIAPLVQIDTAGKEAAASGSTAAADPAGDGKATCAPQTIAMAGPLTGPNSALGINIVMGVKLALDKHNKANPNCQVSVKEFDTEGNPQKATQVIPTIINDQNITALIGPTFSGETKATGQILSDAGLPALSASATNATLTQNGWKTFFRGLANDDLQGPAVAKYLTGAAGFKKICVVQDNTDYGTGLAKAVNEGLGASADAGCAVQVKEGDKDFAAAVSKLKSAAPDAIFYAGYYAEAAPFVNQLRSGGVTATFVSADGVNDPQFVRQGGDATKDALLSCPCGPAPAQFTTDYQALNGQAPGVYSVEGYDLTTIVLKAIDSGKTSRADILEFVRNYDGAGLARQYKWGSNGELTSALIWMYKVQ
ncbi:branched-chain amino acid ABC transporter substrate-binding protein [Nocardia sp. 2]|uniref:Branched-chain amino acid ABC transporter substrate-binding protein n=1 Tax=Nocardia acididurans TaxID=2802282 RepID=A0ABS1MBC4_9NOCA|nr:branched-chain amino acid ABC transporter substrate-binding protein [Nocardia acididurans]MBL1077943.1 branched-chain amino acid ABC transporter substrate-binding protein [Nocardia acididurans]